MQSFSRRDAIRLGALGAGTLLLPGAGLAAADPDQDPHFFLFVVLEGGADPSYMFDARPLSMTRAGKIQNYLGEEPGVWTGSNGAATLATRLVAPLRTFGDHKGSGLALMCELLGGALTGNSCATPGRPFANGMMSIYIDPQRLDPEGMFPPEVVRYMDFVKAARPAPPASETLLPGEPEARTRARRYRGRLRTARSASFHRPNSPRPRCTYTASRPAAAPRRQVARAGQ